MSDVPIALSFYKVGGALPQDVPSYVTRESDRELYEALKAGEFCYVLNSRQMGKSSLMVRTLVRLQAEGWAGIILDFSAKDSQADRPDRWYDGIINQLNRQFKLLDRSDFRSWLKERDFIAPVERLAEFIETVLLPGIDRPIVIFIDEIDSTLNLPFTDDFFALIRACYNKRAENPDYQRLTFALLGVAAPSELIGDAKRTPFNIGQSIDLKGFEFEEAKPLTAGLTAKADRPQAVLQAILHWTGGQPFLTQRLCQLVVDSRDLITAGSEATRIEELVHSRLIENWESQDHQEHLKTIRKRLLDNEQKAGYLLELYRQVRQAGALAAHNRPEERELQLSGLVVKRDGKLQVYNSIYAAVFDEAWIDAELKKLRPYSEGFRAWLTSGKIDASRLLRGEALAEAEQWAAEKTTLSAEDREFLAASRAQQREEEITAKEQEAELAREKAAREAAETAEQIQAEANQQAQRKIRRSSLVLGVSLAAAVILGGLAVFSGTRLRVASQQLEESQRLVSKAEQDLQDVQKELAAARQSALLADQELEQSQKELQTVEIKRQEATDRLKKAEQGKQVAQALLAQLEQDLEVANKAVEHAKRAKEDAQRLTEQAYAKREEAERQEQVATNNLENLEESLKNVRVLAKLAGSLGVEGLYVKANETFRQVGLSFNIQDHQLRQAMLLSNISLAYQHLGEWEAAERPIEDSLNQLGAQVDVDASPEELPIRLLAYYTQGSLLQEQGLAEQALEAYEKAFEVFKSVRNSDQDLSSTLFHLTRNRIRPVFPGFSVSGGGGGTICCIVQDAEGQKYVLGSTSVFDQEGAPIIQPGVFDGGRQSSDQIATLTKKLPIQRDHVNTVDGAIARLREDIEFSPEIPGIGKIQGIAMDVQVGDTVQVVGRTFGLVEGKVDAINVSERIFIAPNESVEFEGLIRTIGISAGSDAGAPVLTEDNKLVGMVFAQSAQSAQSRTETFVIPIKKILQALEVELVQ